MKERVTLIVKHQYGEFLSVSGKYLIFINSGLMRKMKMAMIMHINSISFLKKGVLSCSVISCFIMMGCVATILHDGEVELNEELGSRIQGNFFLYESENEVMESTIDSLLADGVTHHEAVQIALLNNPSIKAMYAHLRVASADVLKAVVPGNPSLHASVLQGNGSGGPKTVVSLEQNLLLSLIHI